MNHIHFESIDSTNTYLKEHYLELDDFTVCSATHQEKGKGRLGRCWEDDKSQALFSILLKRTIASSDLNRYPFIAAVAVHRILVQWLPDLKIKWPNDLLFHDLKVAGILCESVMDSTLQAFIIGIGINVNTKTFPSHLKALATSLFQATNQTYDCRKIIESIVSSFEETLSSFQTNPNDIIHYCNHYSSLTNRQISFIKDNQIMTGNVRSINTDATLLVETQTEVISLVSGEVTLLKEK